MAAHTLSSSTAAKIREGTCLSSLPPRVPYISLSYCSLKLTNKPQAIDAQTASPTKNIPGFVFISVNKAGDEIFAHASGHRGAESKEKLSLESTFWIASCTKMVGAIACMQLVEKEVLGLDDAQVSFPCPYLYLDRSGYGVDGVRS